MNSKLIQKLKEKDLELSPVDKQTSERIKKISKALDGANSLTIVHLAIELLEKSLGKIVKLHKNGRSYDITINTYSKYPELETNTVNE